MAARAPEQVRRLLVGSGAWPPAQRAAAAPGSPSCTRVRGTLMIMDAGPSPAHLGWHTVCGLAQGARRRPSWGGGQGWSWRLWAVPGAGAGPDPWSALDSKSLLDSLVSAVTLIPIY